MTANVCALLSQKVSSLRHKVTSVAAARLTSVTSYHGFKTCAERAKTYQGGQRSSFSARDRNIKLDENNTVECERCHVGREIIWMRQRNLSTFQEGRACHVLNGVTSQGRKGEFQEDGNGNGEKGGRRGKAECRIELGLKVWWRQREPKYVEMGMHGGRNGGWWDREKMRFFLNLHDSLWSGGRLQLSLLKLYERKWRL